MMFISMNVGTSQVAQTNALVIILSLTPCIQPDKIYNFSFKSSFSSPLPIIPSLRHQHLTSQVLSPSNSSCFLSYPYNPSTDVSDNNTSLFNLLQWLSTNSKQNPKFLSWPTRLCVICPFPTSPISFLIIFLYSHLLSHIDLLALLGTRQP